MQTLILKGFTEDNSSTEGGHVLLTFRVEGSGVLRPGEHHVEGRHKEARRAVGNAVGRMFGIHPDDITVIKDAFTDHAYELELALKTEAWIKNGKSTTPRDPRQHPIETIVSGFLAALQNAQHDERPVRRRAL